jgi:hypothetical protein
VARRLGVAPATLRTWDRRYGLGPSEHVAGAHRRYSGLDVARLDLMRRLVNTGVPPGDAARAALEATVASSPLDGGPPHSRAHVGASAGGAGASVDAHSPESLDDGVSNADDPFDLAVAITTGAGGGAVLALPGGTPAIRGLARAAASLDPHACADAVRESVERRGVVWTWDHLLVPVLVGIGRRWERTGLGVEVEHVLSEAVISALSGVTGRVRHPVNARPVLLACAAEEMHTLPLFAVAAGLAERRISSRVLGARVPHDALVAAIRRTGPAAVLVWSNLPATGNVAVLADLPSLRPAPTVLAAGPGWSGPLPDGVAAVSDLVEAITRISRAAGG